ncbi:MAG: hypothetical protein Q4C77_17050 [Eubacteriales bacterium]|nr:hypothetical protein [Eubacteriales bacterium]
MADSRRDASGYSIRTYSLRIHSQHPEWLEQNQKLFGEAETFYLHLLANQELLWSLGSQALMRELEKQTVSSRNNPLPPHPLPWEKLPSYFRRAAINTAITFWRSCQSRGQVDIPEQIQGTALFYNRMYRNLSSTQVELRIWTGEAWKWLPCTLTGGSLPDQGSIQWLSPYTVKRHKYFMLHVPVRIPVYDTRKLQQRITAGEPLCGVHFTNTDAFAVACIIDGRERQQAVRYFKGGRQYQHQCSKALASIAKSNTSHGAEGQPRANQRYWMYLKHVNDHWANRISKEIIDFCMENGATVIAVADYHPDFERAVMTKVGNWSPLHLSTRIRNCLLYKAWRNGILIANIPSFNTAAKNQPGDDRLNKARNIARQCRENFVKQR